MNEQYIKSIWRAFPINEQIHISDLYSLFQIHYDKDYEFAGETHNFWECLYVMDGEVCVSADERVYNLKSGEIIFHKPLELHKFTVTSNGGVDVLIFSFSAEGSLTVWLRDKVFGLSAVQKTLIEAMLMYIQLQKAADVQPQKEYRYLLPYEHLPNYMQMIVTYLYQLFLSLADEGIVSEVSSAPDAMIFGKAIGYLNSNLDRQPTILEIARFCNVSESSLKRVFDRYAGMGVHKYLLKLKIKAAMELLQDGEGVSAVAERVGFSSQSYFSKAFKRETGQNPTEFKR